MAQITLKDVWKRFGDMVAVKDLNLEIRDREFLVLLGPSGCGKTTTLRAIAGLETIDEGDILIEGRKVNDIRASDRDIAFVFQLYALYPHMSVYKNIAFPLESQGVTKSEVERQVREVAEILQIGHILKKKPGSLSGGDMQRVALGRAMVRRPKAFLMDEPIGTLDAKFREEMRTELKRLHIDIDATTVYVTHDQVEAMSMGDRIAVMKNAELQQVGRPSEVYDNPVNLFVANFIGSPGMNFMDVTCSRSDHTMTASMRNDRSICFAFSEKVYRKLEDKGAFGKNLVLGIRPEWVVIDQAQSDGAAPAEVYVVELLGPNKIVDLKVGNDIIKARTGAEFSADIGDRVWVRFNEKKVHFFDKDSGDAIDIT